MTRDDNWTEVHYRRGRMVPRSRLNFPQRRSNFRGRPFSRNRPSANDVAYRMSSADRCEYRTRPYRNRPISNDVAHQRGGADRCEYRTRPHQNHRPRPYQDRSISNDVAYRRGGANRFDYRTTHYKQNDATQQNNDNYPILYQNKPKYRIDYRNRATDRSPSSNQPTYAQVVKGDQLRGRKQPGPSFPSRRIQNHSNISPNQPPKMSATPKLRTMAKSMVKLIKMVHHLHKVADENIQPPTFTALENYLTTIIHPAYPCDGTQLLIEGNAKNWMHTTYLILQEHYKQGIEDTLASLVPLLEENWHVAFDIAQRWAKRQLGQRLTPDTITRVEALITAEFPKTTDAEAGENTSGRQEVNLIDMDVQEPPSISSKDKSTEENPSSAPPPSHLNAQSEPLEQRPLRSKRQINPCVQVVDTEIVACPLGHGDLETEVTRRSGAPVVSRQSAELQDSIIDLNLETQNIRSDETSKTPAKERVETQTDRTPHKTPTQDISPILAPVTNTGLITKQTVLTTPINKVNRHIQTNRKLTDWGLAIRKKWVIIGDSNLSRIPPFQIPDLQLDSYPGATFLHAETLLKGATISVSVEKMVLSFGINHRDQKAQETAIKQLQGAVRAVKKRLPHTEIWIPEINFPNTLSAPQKDTLLELNRYIRTHTGCIPALPGDEYGVVDGTHWTKDTARAMLQHWAQFLNFRAL